MVRTNIVPRLTVFAALTARENNQFWRPPSCYPTRYPGDVSNKRTTKLGTTENQNRDNK